MAEPFRDRFAAGQVLARALASYADAPDLLVLGLPRGGVPVAYEVACALKAPLDIFLVRKLGVPGHEELAMGAIADGGVRVVNQGVLGGRSIPSDILERVSEQERQELARRSAEYRDGRPPANLTGRTVILVDDGLATGSTMRAAAVAARQQAPRRLVIGVPVAPPQTCEALRTLADDVVCVLMPEQFYAVGEWYEDFEQTTDEQVRDLLARANWEA